MMAHGNMLAPHELTRLCVIVKAPHVYLHDLPGRTSITVTTRKRDPSLSIQPKCVTLTCAERIITAVHDHYIQELWVDAQPGVFAERRKISPGVIATLTYDVTHMLLATGTPVRTARNGLLVNLRAHALPGSSGSAFASYTLYEAFYVQPPLRDPKRESSRTCVVKKGGVSTAIMKLLAHAEDDANELCNDELFKKDAGTHLKLTGLTHVRDGYVGLLADELQTALDVSGLVSEIASE